MKDTTPRAGADEIVARHPLAMKLIAWLGTAMGVGFVIAGFGFAGNAIDAFLWVLGGIFAVAGAALVVHLSERTIASSDGVIWRKYLRRRRMLVWSDIDEVADRETSLSFRCSWRDTTVRMSRWLPEFDDLLERARQHVDVDALLAARMDRRLPATYLVGLNFAAGWLFFVAIVVALSVLAIATRDIFITGLTLAAAAFTATRTPVLWLEIHEDRFVLRRLLRRTVVPFSAVAKIELATTEFYAEYEIKSGQLTSNRIILNLSTGTKLEFAPRRGALAVGLLAKRTFQSWQATAGAVAQA